MNRNPARELDELYYDYQARRLMVQQDVKKRGRFLHTSSVIVNKGSTLKPVWEKLKVQGTYVKS